MRGRNLGGVLVLAAALTLTSGASAVTRVSADLNVHLGSRPAPVVVFEREPDVVLVPSSRVYYVGATRARKMLVVAGGSATRVGYLDSSRIYRLYGERKAQLEVGREGDIDKLAHLAWSFLTNLPSRTT